MSQIRKLASGGSTTWGKFTKDGVVYDLNDETVRNNVLNRLAASAGEYGDFYEQLLAPLRNGEDRSGDSISNRTDLVPGFSNVSDKTNRNLNSTDRTIRQKKRDARRQNDTWVSQNAIKNFLAAFQGVNQDSKPSSDNLQTINNDLRVFDYDPENGGFLKNGDGDSIANSAIKNRLRYYFDYLSDNDSWNKAYKWSNPLDSKIDSDLKAWYETLGTDPTSRRSQLEAIVNQAIDTASKAQTWGDVDENTKKILAYFNIGVPVGTPEETEAAANKKTKKSWTDAGWNEALYDQYGDIFELGSDGSLKVRNGQTFNLGDWHNGRNIYFNDDFYASDLAKTGAYDALKGLTYYNGKLYQISDPNLARILNSENGYNAMLKAGNWTGADNEIMTRFTNGARENPGILAADKYSSFLASNPNYRFQNLTGLQTLTNRALKPGEQIIQYVDLSNPDVISGNPYLDYTYKYRLLNENGDDLGEIDPNTLQDVINGQVQDFNTYTKIVGTDDSPYEGMYYRDYKDRNGNEIPIRIYRDSNDPDNVILHLPSLSAHNTTGNDLRLPTEVAKYITNNNKLLAILASDPKRLEQFQDIVSTLVQSGFRASNYFQHPLYSFIEGDLFGSEVKRLRNMGFSKEEAKGLWKAISKYTLTKGGNRTNRREQLLVTAPLSQKMGGKLGYIEKLAKGGKSGGTTNATSKDKKLDVTLRNYGDASGLGDIGTKNWTKADTADLVALGADLASAGIILADPTNIAGAASGVGASLARFRADTLRHKVNPNAGKGAGWNLALNLGMDAVSLIPILGDVTKTAQTANAIRKSLPTILKLIAVAGIGDAALTSAKKIASGEKWTIRDLSVVVNAVNAGIAMSRMGGFGKSSKTNKVFQSQKVKVGDKEIELNATTIQEIANKKAGEQAKALEDAIKAHPNAAGATDEQVATAAKNLLKNKKSVWQWVRRKDGDQVLDTTKVKGDETTSTNSETALGRWWRGEGEDRADYLARLRGENWRNTQTINIPENTTPGLMNMNVPTVVTQTKVPVNGSWQPMSPHILAPFHTHTGYTYPPLPDYNPEVQVPSLTYEPYMAKNGGVIKAANGVPQLYNTDFLNKKTNFTINPITGKPEDVNQIQFTPTVQNSSKVNITKNNPLGLNFDFLNKGTLQKWNPITRKFEFNLPSLNLPDYSKIETKSAPTVTSLFPGNYDVTKIRTPQQTNATGVGGTTGQVAGAGGQPLDAKFVEKQPINDFWLGASELAGTLAGIDAVTREQMPNNPPMQQSLSARLMRNDSPALQAEANALREKMSNWRKATTSDNIQNNALKMQSDTQVLNALRDNTARQSQFQWQADLQNNQTSNEIDRINNQIAYQNAGVLYNVENSRKQLKASGLLQKLQSVLGWSRENRYKLNQDKEAIIAQNINEMLKSKNAKLDKQLQDTFADEYQKWQTVDQSLYDNDFRTYLSKVYSNKYNPVKDLWDKEYNKAMKDTADYAKTSKLNFPFLYRQNAKKGGRLNGKTRYTLEPDERIWIDNNKAVHNYVAKLNDNAIKLLLRALK